MIDLDTIEAVALAATANVRDNGYHIVAPDEEVIFDYKHSEHANARADAALFGHAREYVLTLVAAVRERGSATDAYLRAAAIVRAVADEDEASASEDGSREKDKHAAMVSVAALRDAAARIDRHSRGEPMLSASANFDESMEIQKLSGEIATLRAAVREFLEADDAHATASTERGMARAIGVLRSAYEETYHAAYSRLTDARKALAALVP